LLDRTLRIGVLLSAVTGVSLAHAEELELLAADVPGPITKQGKPEKVTTETGDDQRQSRLVRNVTRPTLWIHRPSEKRAVRSWPRLFESWMLDVGLLACNESRPSI